MLKIQMTLVASSLALFVAPSSDNGVTRQFKEESLVIEYTSAAGEAALLMSAESETPLGMVELRDPFGKPALRLQAGNGRNLSLSGFGVESRESQLAELLAAYPEGQYAFSGRALAGHAIVGAATLSHELPRPATVLWPLDGARDVPGEGLTVSWEGDPQAAGFHVILEQGEDDGISIQVPAGSSSLEIPDGVLEQGVETLLEIGTIGPNGNRTLVEVSFTTR
jgi:hypothetical protein